MQLAQSGLILFLTALMPSPQGTGQQPTVQQPAPLEKPAGKIDPTTLPVDLERIQRALAHTPKLQIDPLSNRPVFRVQVFGEKASIEDILGPDFAKGPVPYGSMTHQEFLRMVTPDEARGYAGFTNREGITVATSSFALQWALQKAIAKFNETQDARAREAARQEVIEAMNALEEARAKAGLPRK